MLKSWAMDTRNGERAPTRSSLASSCHSAERVNSYGYVATIQMCLLPAVTWKGSRACAVPGPKSGLYKARVLPPSLRIKLEAVLSPWGAASKQAVSQPVACDAVTDPESLATLQCKVLLCAMPRESLCKAYRHGPGRGWSLIYKPSADAAARVQTRLNLPAGRRVGKACRADSILERTAPSGHMSL